MDEDSRMWRSLKELTESEPLDPEQVGVDPRFMLSFHYELIMPGTYHVAPGTSAKAWSEPALILFVSVNHPDWPTRQQVLHYGLSRSFFSSGLDPSAEDRAKLMAAAIPLLKEDIERIDHPKVPDSLPKTKFI